MNRNLLFLPIFVFLVLTLSISAYSNVLIGSAIGTSVDSNGSTSEQLVLDGAQAGNYVIFSCVVANDIGNAFNTPTPGTWTELDQGDCGGTGRLCGHGIWGGFTDDPGIQFLTCSWTETSSVFAAGSISYSDVDTTNPIIGVDCNTGLGTELIAPSIITEAGSQVLRVYTSGAITHAMTEVNPAIANRAVPEDEWAASADSDSQHIRSEGISALTLVAGPTGTDSVTVEILSQWRACTLALRMQPRAVPTMSEWGLISFAAFAGIAGIWYLRRRQVTA